MARRFVPVLLALLVASGCAGPSQLAERSEARLAVGEHWRAWELATRALDKEPGNRRARAAAAAAAAAIAENWRHRVRALADVDSVAAAEQVLEFVEFRARAVSYAVVPVTSEWSRDEKTLRATAARLHYQRGAAALRSHRPKRAHFHFSEAQRFIEAYRDAAVLADRAFERALTRVAVVPFSAPSGHSGLGGEVAAAWRDELARRLSPPHARYTRIAGSEAVEGEMRVSQLGRISREEAVRLGRRARVDRVVWGSIGSVDSDTRLQVFTDVIARRIVEKDAEGRESVRWVDVPIEVVARVRTVRVDAEYELIGTRSGASLARRRAEHSSGARAVWTSYVPEGSLDAYALVSETVRASNPDRARDVEVRWKSVCGETTTLRQVLEARRSTRSETRYRRTVLPRIIAGAAFVFLEDLPPVGDLAFAALAGGWQALHQDLARLDAVDDADLGVAMGEADVTR